MVVRIVERNHAMGEELRLQIFLFEFSNGGTDADMLLIEVNTISDPSI